MRVLALEPLDEGGGFRRDGARLAAILTRLGDKRGESVAAITQRPIQQRVHRDLAARGMGDVVEARGDFLGAARQFAAWQRLQHQRGDESVTEECDFFGFVFHRDVFLLDVSLRRKAAASIQMVCGEAQAGAAAEENAARRPSGARPRGQPSRCWRRPENRKRCAGIQPAGFEHGRARGGRSRARAPAWSMRPAWRRALRLAGESGGARTGRAGRASRRAVAPAPRVCPWSSRAMRNRAMTARLERK